MGEIPQYPHYDSESSESEKDSIDASFELIIGSLEFMCEKILQIFADDERCGQ
jgi:hypothetical protein